MSVGQVTKSSKTRVVPVIAILLALALLLILAVTRPWEGDHGIKSQIKVSVLNEQGTETHRLQSEARFALRFWAPGFQAKDGQDLQTGLDLTLQRDGKPLELLTSKLDGSEPEIQPLDGDGLLDTPLVAVMVPTVPRSLKYRLPQLEPGRYELCQHFALWADPVPPEDKGTLLEKAVICLAIEVVS